MKLDPRVPRMKQGKVAAHPTAGGMLVDIGEGALVPVPQDVRGPVPVGTVVVLQYALGAYTLVQAVGDPQTVAPDVRITRSPNPAPAGQGWEEVTATWTRVVGGVTEVYYQVATMPPPPTGTTLVVKAVLADNWDSTNTRWGGDVPKQGEYGYGMRSAYWWFAPADMATINAGTWSKVTVRVVRQTSGGVYRAVPVTLWTHAHDTKPNGTPTRANGVEAGSVAPGAELVFDTTDPRWLAAFTTAKGVAAHRDTGEYVVFEPVCTLTFHP